MLINAYSDFNYQQTLTPNANSVLLTGSGGDYITRLASLHFFKNGNKVIRMTHGGDSVFFNDPSWATIELPFITEYISYGIESSKINTKKIVYHIRFHLLPNCNAILTNNKKTVILQIKDQSWLFKTNSEASIEDSIYINHENKIQQTKQIVLSGYVSDKKKTENWVIIKHD